MSVTREDVIWAYRMILGREPESEAAIEHKIARLQSRKELRRALLCSKEFVGTASPVELENSQNFLKTERAESLSPTVIHLHIPKTAGTSLNEKLAENYASRPKWSYHDQNITKFFELTPEERSHLDLIFGHMDYGIHEYIPREHVYLFVLRKPIDRIYSYYNYVGKNKEHPLFGKVKTGPENFGKFLRQSMSRSEIQKEINNSQARRIAGDYDKQELSPSDCLKKACHISFAPNVHFGLTEDFGEYLQRLHKLGHVAQTSEIQRNALNSQSSLEKALEGLSSQESEILKDYTLIDDKLYKSCHEFIEFNKNKK
ncbi:sulfotransferase family 2 domain-containing protein [Stappia taiwanensis]|uniref:Sulfotransferase family 2 domain-containing protein n=1 Tax=Stappia taiwanensis TaxID=992267 RepID=A0A838XQM2_9HYPH|nr:sulfotransferase family 2 domain-containing protein [Stappia taiwanensis]MBA4610886.1 sulfotransferase family 2 domain-containing protein [Stappia taiwanensis]GGE95103.1 hypothetical protein GCM10007285_23440 [Stappia taiwanensis]